MKAHAHPWQDGRGLGYLREALCSAAGTRGVTEGTQTAEQLEGAAQETFLILLLSLDFCAAGQGFSDLSINPHVHPPSYLSSVKGVTFFIKYDIL